MGRYESIGGISGQEARKLAAQCFPEEAKLYAVLDFTVCFGIYHKDRFMVGLEEQSEPSALDWNYLRELRIFNENQELLLVPSEGGWCGRIRRDAGNSEEAEGAGEYVLDERQKLWGKVNKDRKNGIDGWSTLVSGRGSRIQIPVETVGEEAAIYVRRYLRIPDVVKGEELVFQKDIRMVDFCTWRGDEEDERK